MGQSKHDKIARNLAKKHKTEYNEGPGPDVLAKNKVIEVVSHESDLYPSIDQLKGYQKPKYIATKGTGIGVMGPTGIIRKKAGGK
jgi:hypothetical protein